VNIKSVGLVLLLLGLVLLLLPAAVLAEPVIGVSDGDTLTVLRDRQPIKIRLSEIDEPENLSRSGIDRSNRFRNCATARMPRLTRRRPTAMAGRSPL